jgi:endonuclease YncB( thermonuclease family)
MIRKSFFQLFLIFALAFLYVTCTDTNKAQTYEGKVIKVTDGDSINILYEGKTLRIRLAEIDAPERGQPFWKKSREALADYVAGEEVQIIEVDIDRYKRVVGQVYLGDLWVNGALVRGGFAYVYPEYATSERLYKFEREAKESKTGIWKLPENERVKPWEWRKQKRASK